MFKLPIEYNHHHELNPNLIQELELVSTVDSSNTPIYHKLFSPNNNSKQIISQMVKYYTTNINFLKETQLFHKQFTRKIHNYDDFITHWTTLQNNKEFNLTYQYIEHNRFTYLNESSKFMMLISLYFITSPILFILTPIILILIPFALILSQGQLLSWNTYKTKFLEITKHHSLINLCTSYATATPKERIYLITSASIFLIQTYCNGYAIYKFYTNIQNIHTIMESLQQHIHETIGHMNFIESTYSNLTTYSSFINTMKQHQSILIKYSNQLTFLKKISFSWNEIIHLGTLRSTFYELYSNQELKTSIEYSIQFNHFLSNIEHLHTLQLNHCTFSKKTKFLKAYYPTHNPITNSYSLDKNIIITGPNASGKTTFIKMTLINLLLSQQFGCGFYKKASVNPFDQFCSYINIPDTSGRDSLFQAEARRCKEVLECVKNTQSRVFCIFDELFSGTNPSEASASAFAFLQYLSTYHNCSFLLTTHFINVCNQLQKNSYIRMKHMKTLMNNDKLQYTYKLSNGISNIQGGIHILVDMDYPIDIINNAKLCG
jgi:hypothetical protein